MSRRVQTVLLRSMVFRTAVVPLFVLAAAASCSEPPPEGFTLRLRFTSINPSAIDEVRVSFQPRGDNEAFDLVEPMSYADGAINLVVNADGTLTLTLDGAHVALTGERQPDNSFTYDLEVYTEDMKRRVPPPGVRVVVTQDGESIAQGFRYLPEWPLPLGQLETIMVPCDSGAIARCTR